MTLSAITFAKSGDQMFFLASIGTKKEKLRSKNEKHLRDTTVKFSSGGTKRGEF